MLGCLLWHLLSNCCHIVNDSHLMWEPSISPKQYGNPEILSNPAIANFSISIYITYSTKWSSLHLSQVYYLRVHTLPRQPKAKNQSYLISTGNAFQIIVFERVGLSLSFIITSLNSSYRIRKRALHAQVFKNNALRAYLKINRCRYEVSHGRSILLHTRPDF